MKRYYIIGIYNGRKETLDCFDTLAEATKVMPEYRLAFGPKWVIDIVLK